MIDCVIRKLLIQRLVFRTTANKTQKIDFREFLHLPENTFDRKRISANPNSNPKALYFRTDKMT